MFSKIDYSLENKAKKKQQKKEQKTPKKQTNKRPMRNCEGISRTPYLAKALSM